MCGIAGMLQKDLRRSEWEEHLRLMTNSIIHRGPDDSGLWYDIEAGVGLGHRRLSILDLSPLGHQPMVSKSGRYMIVFNGEVYNFNELGRELQSYGHTFRGHSDTEVMLAAIEKWGLEGAVSRFIGMFAFAVWDQGEKKLYLVRDRLGIKPLYYGWCGGAFVFGSELKVFKGHPDFSAEINRDSMTLLLRYNYIPAPFSIYKGIYKLPQGSILSLSSSPEPAILSLDRYWSLQKIAEQGAIDQFGGTLNEAAEELDKLLRDAIKLRMVADVPLGAFLSGGVDSSTVVAVMQSLSRIPVKTFSIGFYEENYNEAVHAKDVANHLATDHTELYVTPEQAMSVIPKLPSLYDEPFSDVSQIPTFLVSELARQHVTVSLSGDGGDELFGGYNRYFWGRSVWQKMGWIPKHLRRFLSKSLTVLPPEKWQSLFESMPFMPNQLKQNNTGDKIHKLSEVLAVNCPDELYLGLVSHWKGPSSVVIDSSEPLTLLKEPDKWPIISDHTKRMMYFDLLTYLPDDILTKVDRASMGVSLEARVPLLDHRIVEFAGRLPLPMKIRGSQGKLLLRKVLYKYVPKELIERPKMGFGVPIDSWLRGPLRDWAYDYLNPERLKREGYFKPEPIVRLWKEHLSGTRNWQYYLWDILMFQTWLEKEKH